MAPRLGLPCGARETNTNMINLLPEEYKQALRQEEWFRLIVILGSLCLAFCVCVSLLLLSMRVYTLGSLDSQDILISAQQKEYEEEKSPAARMREVNTSIVELERFYSSQASVANVLREIGSVLPPDINITSFSYAEGLKRKGVPERISLSGFASRRDSLSDFRERLEKNPMFTNFFFPQTNLANPVDVKFSFTCDIQR